VWFQRRLVGIVRRLGFLRRLGIVRRLGLRLVRFQRRLVG
jgi:hypothetical protein